MKYKVGDKVRIKNLDWYNEKKNQFGQVNCGGKSYTTEMCFFCGKILTIQAIGLDFYLMEEDDLGYEFTDEMIEGLVEEETKFGTASNPLEPKSNTYCSTREMVDELVEEETEKKLSDESWRYKNIFDPLQYPQSFECPDGYIFKDENGNEIRATKIVLEKKKTEYPKTYEECSDILSVYTDPDIDGYKGELLWTFQKLLVCRDAYWKIAGEEMGLGKPWKPDWATDDVKHSLVNVGNTIIPSVECKVSRTFAFPTKEMRDSFFENFKELIEQCKELL